MPSIHEVATLTSKGQVTLPKSIRQALGVAYGDKLAFDLSGSQVVVSRVEDAAHEDPAIAGFLALLERDIRCGQRMTGLPDELARLMLAAVRQPCDPDAEIEGDVAL